MARLTRKKDEFQCRMAGGCPAEEWICECTNKGELAHLPCDNCPFEPIVNKLAEYEDKYEPVEEGTLVYQIVHYHECKYGYQCPLKGNAYQCESEGISPCQYETLIYEIRETPFRKSNYIISMWGEMVFPTIELAKQRIKELEENKE